MVRKLIPLPERPAQAWSGRSHPRSFGQQKIKLEAKTLKIAFSREFGGWDGITYDEISQQLDRFKEGDYDSIEMEIHSAGGDVFTAVGIYNALIQLNKPITATIPGLAASAATVVSLAADDVRIAESAKYMIHNSWSISAGDSEEMRRTADLLDAIDADIAQLYDERTELGVERIRSLMEQETWMGGAEAVEAGFADSLLPAKSKAKDTAKASLNAWLQKHRIK